MSATAPSSLDLPRIRRRRRLGLLFTLAPLPPLFVLTASADLRASIATILCSLGLIIGNYNALLFVPLGCPACRKSLHRSCLWSPFARVCPHCGPAVPR